MALIQCPECGKEVSDKAIECPQCKTKLKEPEPVKKVCCLLYTSPSPRD